MGKLKDRSAIAELLSDDATFATTAHIIAYDQYGDETYEMDILELFHRLEEDFKIELSQDLCQKLQAILLATTTDAFFQDPEAFRAVSNTLVEGDPGFMLFDELTVPEILWASYEVSLNHPGTEFSPAVTSLMERELREEGIDSEEELEESTYYDRAMAHLRTNLKGQLRKLGLNPNHLPSAA